MTQIHRFRWSCEVSKGSLVCLLGDINPSNLYVLRGCTLHGSVSAANVANAEPSKTDLCICVLDT